MSHGVPGRVTTPRTAPRQPRTRIRWASAQERTGAPPHHHRQPEEGQLSTETPAPVDIPASTLTTAADALNYPGTVLSVQEAREQAARLVLEAIADSTTFHQHRYAKNIADAAVQTVGLQQADRGYADHVLGLDTRGTGRSGEAINLGATSWVVEVINAFGRPAKGEPDKILWAVIVGGQQIPRLFASKHLALLAYVEAVHSPDRTVDYGTHTAVARALRIPGA